MSTGDQEPVANDRRATATIISREAYSIQIAGGDHGVIDMPELHGGEALALRDELCRWFGLPEGCATIAKDHKVSIDPGEYLRAQRENALLKLELEKQLSSKPPAINGFQESTPASADRQALKAERDEALQKVEELEKHLAWRLGMYAGPERIVRSGGVRSGGAPESFDIEDPDMGETRYYSDVVFGRVKAERDEASQKLGKLMLENARMTAMVIRASEALATASEALDGGEA